MFSRPIIAPAFARIGLVVAAIVLTACADAVTSPRPSLGVPKALRDGGPSDTLQCKSGWVITGGLYSCNP